MAINKVVYGGKTLIDISDSTVAPETLEKGVTAYGKDGEKVTGAFTLESELSTQNILIEQIKTALQGKTAGGGSGSTEPDYKTLYQRVEYIESAEKETYPYIITDAYADNSCGVEVIASFPKLQDRIPMGSRKNSDATRFYCVYPMSASSVYYGFNSGSAISCSLKVDTIYRLQTNFLNSRLVNVYDEQGIRKASASLSATLSEHPVPIAIFGYNSGSSGDVTSKREFKLYRARISNDYEVIRDYVPCYRKSDGVVGLYEKVTGQFLTNDADTGSFAKGKDVEW